MTLGRSSTDTKEDTALRSLGAHGSHASQASVSLGGRAGSPLSDAVEHGLNVRPLRTAEELISATAQIKPLVDTSLLTQHEGQRSVRAAHRVYEHLIALWAPGIIEAAFDLGVFSALSEAPLTSAQLATCIGADESATRVLLESLCVYELIVRTQEHGDSQRYVLPDEMKACLLPNGPLSLAGKIAHDRSVAWNAWRHLADAVRSGNVGADGVAQRNQIAAKDYQSLLSGISFWAPPIVDVLRRALERRGWSADKKTRMLDVGCGTGIYSQLMLQAFPLLTSVGMDVEEVVPIARAQAERMGLRNRFLPTVGDLDGEWKGKFDLVLVANIFHLQTPGQAAALAARTRDALAERGVVAIVDQIIDENDGAGSAQNRFARLFAASMLATGGGGAYSVTQYDEWLESVGLRRFALLDAPMHRILLAAVS